jgi:hypothetical protein
MLNLLIQTIQDRDLQSYALKRIENDFHKNAVLDGRQAAIKFELAKDQLLVMQRCEITFQAMLCPDHFAHLIRMAAEPIDLLTAAANTH